MKESKEIDIGSIDRSTTLGDLAQILAKKIKGCGAISYTGRVLVPLGIENLPLGILSEILNLGIFGRGFVDSSVFPKGFLVPEMSAVGRYISWLERRVPNILLKASRIGLNIPDPTIEEMGQIYDYNVAVRRGLHQVVRFDANGLVDQ